jgi:hypothetical protein
MNKRELSARREALLRLCCKGIPSKNAAEELSKDIEDQSEREQSVIRIIQDWQRRKQWMTQTARLMDPTLLPELLAGMLEVRQSAWTQYATGDNSNAKVGALKVALLTYKEIIEVLQSIGAIERLPTETTLTIASTPFDADPEMKRLLLEAAAKQKAEKDAVKPPDSRP